MYDTALDDTTMLYRWIDYSTYELIYLFSQELAIIPCQLYRHIKLYCYYTRAVQLTMCSPQDVRINSTNAIARLYSPPEYKMVRSCDTILRQCVLGVELCSFYVHTSMSLKLYKGVS